jgi:hypothetical protein
MEGEMRLVCEARGASGKCAGCRWATPWEVKNGSLRTAPGPFEIYGIIGGNAAHPLPHSQAGNCPEARKLGLFVAVRMEVVG